ncbi:hypothetical protein M408DRAFT_12274 [Serendipita vermifera MAFF 305830]|uniref:RFX-type winged-helix domain-containing protein n=1 Tax=Serendipita vermifera MAFF 305830 TaxID=933852 RepID=A0A0C2WXB3_SERVB|nr:hypothetical protein M408DRAFT_12274 [Serendipita vermifera MAFF 305830]
MPPKASTNASGSEATSPRTSILSEDENIGQDENDSNSDIEEEPEEEALGNPSTNIRGELQRIFSTNGFKFVGSYYASQSYPQAPSPQIQVEGVGVINLPLTQDAAKRLIAGCTQAPFGKGERTIVDKKVRDTWEMEASKITFTNPTWTNWIDTVILPTVYEKLGVSIHASQPKAELYKLLLYETGSHFLPHQDSVPSLKPEIRSSPYTQELKHALLSWKLWDHPMKLIYLMDHMYSYQELRQVSLKGKDAHFVANIREVAKELGFRLCLVNLELHQSGQANDYGGFDYYDPYAEEYEEYDEDEDSSDFGGYRRRAQEDLEIGEVEEQNWTFEDAVDLEGNSVQLNEDIELDDDGEYFPRTLTETVPDEEEYEGYMGNHGGNLDLCNVSSLQAFIWRLKFSKDDVGDYAEKNLNQSDSKKASIEEERTAETLITWCETHEVTSEVISALRDAAVRWNDVDLWLRSCQAAGIDGNLDLLGVSTIAEDVELFGFSALTELQVCDNRYIRLHNQTDEPRFRLVSELKSLAEETPDNNLLEWTQKAEERVLRTLRMANLDGIPRYVAATKKHGALYLRETILPQLVALKPPSRFWHMFIKALRQVEVDNSADAEAFKEVIYSLVAQQISTCDPFPVHVVINDQSPGVRTADLEVWFSTIEDAIASSEDALKSYFNRMHSSWEKMVPTEKHWMAMNFFPGAMDRLAKWATACTPPRLPGDTTLEPFWILSLICFLEHHKNQHACLLTALQWCGELKNSQTRLETLIQKLASGPSTQLHEIVKLAYAPNTQPLARNDALIASFKALADMCARTLANYAVLGYPITYNSGEAQFPRSSNLVQILLQAYPRSLKVKKDPPPMMELSQSDLDELAPLKEPTRLIQWMKQMFEEKTGAEMTQAAFCHLYKAAFASHSLDDMPLATDLFKAVTSTYSQSKLVVVPEADGQPRKYMLCGLERRQMVQENSQPHDEGQTAPNPLEILLKRILGSAKNIRYIKETLAPLTLMCIRDAQALGIQWPWQPLSDFATTTIYRLAKQMGPRPTSPLTPAELATFGCGCAQCAEVRQFIVAGNRRMLSIRAAEKVRKHISREIEYKGRDWGFVCTTIRQGSPHTLQITKPEIFGALKTWQENRAFALNFIAKLGPIDALERILGSHWEEVCEILEIPRSSAASSAAPRAPITTQAKSGPSNQRAQTTAARGRGAPIVPQALPQAAKRTFQQAIGSQVSPPAPKRNKPVEIIELSSDSD